MELADTSVWAHKSHPALRAWFAFAIEAGEIAGCDMVALELLHSARNPPEFALVEDALRGLPWVEPDAADWRRAREVYRVLGGRPGIMQRSVKHPDLLIAAAAERAGLTLVHYDADYDAIAQITGQAVRWAAPRGSLSSGFVSERELDTDAGGISRDLGSVPEGGRGRRDGVGVSALLPGSAGHRRDDPEEDIEVITSD